MSRFLFLFLFYNTLLTAQPGGGGGLCIKHFYDKKGREIDIFTDKNFEIRSFVLKKNRILYESAIFETQQNAYKALQKQNPNAAKGKHDFCLLSEIEGLEPDDRENDQRLYIRYKDGPMILDLLNIRGENGMGSHDEMDSVVIEVGHFRYDRNVETRYLRQEKDKNFRKMIQNGLTPSTKKILSETKILEIEKKLDTEFLAEKNLPASYFVHQARSFLKNKTPKPAFEALQQAIFKNKNVKDCPISLLLCEYYTQIADYNAAIAQITDGLTCKIGKYADAETNYRTRINLYLKTGQYAAALADYNTMLDRSDEPFYILMERNDFKMRYTKDYLGAANDMKKLLKELKEEDEGKEDYIGFSRPYYALAQAEYRMGNRTEATTHFLRAMECGLGRTNGGTEIVAQLDTIIQQYSAAELFVARGLAHHGRAQYLGWGEATMTAFAQAILDFDRAEQLGFADYRLNWFRAQSLSESKKHAAALNEINIAIQKNPNAAACYGLRYSIRQQLGQSRYGDKNDPDIVRQAELNGQPRN
jgi:tetratricopeptide (TPR) repeat protein